MNLLDSLHLCITRFGSPSSSVSTNHFTPFRVSSTHATGTSHPRLAFSARRLATAAVDVSSPAPPPLVPNAAPSDPKISRIVDDISGLTLLQAADLVTLLKVCHIVVFWILSAHLRSNTQDASQHSRNCDASCISSTRGCCCRGSCTGGK